MTRFSSFIFIGVLLASFGCSARKGTTPVDAKRSSVPMSSSCRKISDGRELPVKARIRFTLDHLGISGLWKCSRGRKVQGAVLQIIKTATPSSLHEPQLVPSLYFADLVHPTAYVMVTWIEDTPSLAEVIVTNPGANISVPVRIPRSHLKRLQTGPVMQGVIYVYEAKISTADLGLKVTPFPPLGISIKQNKNQVMCYPCDAATQPSTRTE